MRKKLSMNNIIVTSCFICITFLFDYNTPVDFRNDLGFRLAFSISHIDVRNILKNVNPKKAQGPDGIHGKMVKNCDFSITYPFSLVFNTSRRTGIIPKEWKHANVVPVHKNVVKHLWRIIAPSLLHA